MAVDAGALHKILEQEVKRGYTDSTVIGGLDKFLQLWLSILTASAGNTTLNRDQLRHFSASYSSMSANQRRRWVKSTLEFLSKLGGDASGKKSSEEKTVTGPSGPVSTPVTAAVPRTGNHPERPVPASPSLDSPVTMIKGISEVLKKKFEKLGISTIHDLLYYFPHRHIDYSMRVFINSLVIGKENTVIANVWEAREVMLGSMRSTEATVGDETGNIRIIWFNQPYLAKTIKTGQRLVISGKVSIFNGILQFESPEWEPFEEKDLVHTGRLIPVYPLTQGLSQRQVRRVIKPAIDRWAPQLEDFLPRQMRERLKFPELSEAIRQAHYPQDEAKKDESRRRLAFDELFLLQLGVLNKKRFWQESQPGTPVKIRQPELNNFLSALPFKLTPAQDRVLKEILADLQKSRPMSRLLQGEVGSGKTVVAAAAMIEVVADDRQSVLMAPTEILAEQHFKTIRHLLSRVATEEGEDFIYSYSGLLERPLKLALLLGEQKKINKKKIHQLINSGEIDIVIGTHALIQKGVEFAGLGLIVVDEQHRFGVEQRSALRKKGLNPHMLAMTATPIPRSLALTLYGDLDLSVIDVLPPGRQVIKTRWLAPERRADAYRFLSNQVKLGRQAFIICPLVEESEAIQARAAVAEYERLSVEVFPELRLGLLHGRMSQPGKDGTMQQFSRGEVDILVSTPVIEVGIDVPNATVMLIESADRFGLSQLHQFRGRVGRGTEQSYCLLLAERPSEIGKERLDLIEKIHNGFMLAEEDLKLRGPGEFFGTRQSGLPDLKMARLSDSNILELARNEASRLFGKDPHLSQPEHRCLAEEMKKVWKNNKLNDWS
ncbi:MAG: ATP-dependent DNA helicase RecG [Dehalococcoidales bacterium]|nr:ATP-dependent DNA helicase RecG [Dehalococcoidales bacterium]